MRELVSITRQKLEQLLGDNPPMRDTWLIKCRRLREIVSNLPANQIITTSIPEGHSNLLLINIIIKAHAMMQLLRGTVIDFAEDNDPYQMRFTEFLSANELALRDAIIQRLVVGLGAVCVVGDSQIGWRLQSVCPSDLWWDTTTGDVMQPKWVAREYRDHDGVRYREVWYPDRYHRYRLDSPDVETHENPYGVIPIVLFPAHHIPDTVYPIGDVELACPQQFILDEIRRTYLNMARRGAGFYAVKRTSIDEQELVRLQNPDEVYILVNEQDAIMPIPTPAPNPEWQALEALAKQDMDALMGISEYVRGVLPSGRAKFATEVVAAVAGQTVRIQAEWYNTKVALERLAMVYYKLHNPSGTAIPRALEDSIASVNQLTRADIVADAAGGGGEAKGNISVAQSV
jgi:hypothetical protein